MLAFLSMSSAPAVAQDKSSTSVGYVPSLGDMMTGAQLRHSKLWYAAKYKNWSLAEYELVQLTASLKQAAGFYPDMPASNLAATGQAAALVGESIKAKDVAAFAKSFVQMTTACNGCHEAAGRAFIFVRSAPPFPSPFSNQMFAPRPK